MWNKNISYGLFLDYTTVHGYGSFEKGAKQGLIVRQK